MTTTTVPSTATSSSSKPATGAAKPSFIPVATLRRPDGLETLIVRDKCGSHLLQSPASTDWLPVFKDGAGNWIERGTGIVHARNGATIHPRDIYGPLPEEDTRNVKTQAAASIKPDPVRWLWPGWLAAGKVHLLAGAPGTGKTTVSMALAATVSLGGAWPDGTEAVQGDVLVWSGEDDMKDLSPTAHGCRG